SACPYCRKLVCRERSVENAVRTDPQAQPGRRAGQGLDVEVIRRRYRDQRLLQGFDDPLALGTATEPPKIPFCPPAQLYVIVHGAGYSVSSSSSSTADSGRVSPRVSSSSAAARPCTYSGACASRKSSSAVSSTAEMTATGFPCRVTIVGRFER